jgi:transposase InsO family protein
VRSLANTVLDVQVAAIHAQSRRSYGRERIVRQLHAQGFSPGHERVRKSLLRQKLRPVYRRPYRVTTDSKHDEPIAANILRDPSYSEPDPTPADDPGSVERFQS